MRDAHVAPAREHGITTQPSPTMPAMAEPSQARQARINRERKAKRHSDLARQHRRAAELRQLQELAIAQSTPLEEIGHCDPVDAAQLIMNRTLHLLRNASARADSLTPGVANNQSEHDKEWMRGWDKEGNTVLMPSHWILMEDQLRQQLFDMCAKAAHLGIAERRTRVAEAQMELLGKALKEACRAAGLDSATQATLGSALRDQLQLLEGSSREVA